MTKSIVELKQKKACVVISVLLGLLVNSCANPDAENGAVQQVDSDQLAQNYAQKTAQQPAPNIVLVMTDDQGYGDIGVLGNPIVKTPSIDSLYNESVRFTDFHVDPTCSPTRAALMTGQHSMRAGVWHTVMGRSLLATEKVTIAEYLSDAGYRTGIFGKWHLGDNYPYRPEDQGFDHVLIHGGGGVGQTPDYWGNTQFDDTYFENGQPRAFKGNATDVWFDEAEKFLTTTTDQPLFAYVALNSPHTPWRAPDSYIRPYLDLGLSGPMAAFYGMITHVDERLGQLRSLTRSMPNGRDTLFVFMTDNGSSFSFSLPQMGAKRSQNAPTVVEEFKKQQNVQEWQINAGMRGYKTEVYDGGHRVPFMVSGLDIVGGRDVSQLAAHFDLLPTLLEIAGVIPDKPEWDGQSLAPYLWDESLESTDNREIVVTNQRVFNPSFERPMAVITKRWRYVVHGETNSIELFDIIADPMQETNVISQNPAVAKRLQTSLEDWWKPFADGLPPTIIPIGGNAPKAVRLTSMDWMEAPSTADVPWFPGHYFEGKSKGWIGNEDDFNPLPWYLNAETDGIYHIELMLHDRPARQAIGAKVAILQINGIKYLAKIEPKDTSAHFDVELKAGFTKLGGWFKQDAQTQNVMPAFFSYVTSGK